MANRYTLDSATIDSAPRSLRLPPAILRWVTACIVALCVLCATPAYAYTAGDAPRDTEHNYLFFAEDINNPAVAALYGAQDAALPARFNLRDVIDIPVADQGSLGLCTVFATMKCVETNYALKTGSYIDLSERYVDYMASSYVLADQRNPGALPTEDTGVFGTEGDGATSGETLAVLETYGAPTEAAVPYGNYTHAQMQALESATPAVRVTSTVGFPDISDIKDEALYTAWVNIVKTHIMKYGSISIPIWAPSWGSSYNEETCAYLFRAGLTETDGGHEVSIVGWDDSFSKDNFVVQPKHDGAFICLNSWGEEFGDHGYFYVSYESDQFLNQPFGVIDTTGPAPLTTYRNADKLLTASGNSPSASRFYATTFKADGADEAISHIVAGITRLDDLNPNVKVRLYVNPADGSLDKDKLVYIAETSPLVMGGLTHFNLSQPLPLEGEEYALVFELVGTEADHNMLDSMDADGNVISGHFVQAMTLDAPWEPCSFDVPVYVTTYNSAAELPSPSTPLVPDNSEVPAEPEPGGELPNEDPPYEEPAMPDEDPPYVEPAVPDDPPAVDPAQQPTKDSDNTQKPANTAGTPASAASTNRSQSNTTAQTQPASTTQQTTAAPQVATTTSTSRQTTATQPAAAAPQPRQATPNTADAARARLALLCGIALCAGCTTVAASTRLRQPCHNRKVAR